MANTVGFWDSVVEKPVRLGCCWSCREGPGGSVSCRVAVTLGSPPFPSSFHGPCTVDPRGSQTLAQLGDRAGGCPAGCLGSYGPYLYNPLLPVPAPPCWRLSVRTAPSPCWTRACLRCKCKEEHWDQALGSGVAGGWLLFLCREVHCLLQGDGVMAAGCLLAITLLLGLAFCLPGGRSALFQ